MDPSQKNILEIKEADFNEIVIEGSESKLILVDFWAPWCGPCKQLTPLLEKIIKTTEEKVLLVKINIDENQQIAAQLRIQSIPAVFAFKNKQPVDAFQGVIPENKIIEFIEKNLGEKITKDFSSFYESIQKMMDESEFKNSVDKLESFIADNPEEFKAISLYLECLSFLEKYDEIDDFIKSLNNEAIKNNYIKSVIQKIDIKKKNISGPSLETLLNNFKNDSKNFSHLEELANKYFAENMLDEAFTVLIDNYPKEKEMIKKKILEFFEALGNENKKTQEYRKKFSSIMFS